ncbi:hypothetical protein B0H14DRAFT_2581880 [Mycena olivaceomarginata]|nr:hypothetical protein B0H14DRAFT_2581880 [Mycena olivaceomarginata]
MPSRAIRVPALVPGVGLHGRPFAEPHRATPRRSPVALPLSSPRPRNPIALADDALAAVHRGRNDVLGTVPFAWFSRIRFGASLRAFPPATRRSRARKLCPSPQTHLHRFHDDAESPRPAARDPPIDVPPGASLVAQTSPHSGIPTVQLRVKARFPPRTLAVRTVASLTVTLPYAPPTPSTALGSTQTHRFVYRSRAFYPEAAPCTSQLDAYHRTLPTHIPARLDVRLTIARAASGPLRDPADARCSRSAMGSAPPRVRPPLLPHAANPIAHGHSLNGEYSDGDGTTRTGARASASRDNPNATAERHLGRGPRMGATRRARGLAQLGRRRRMPREGTSRAPDARIYPHPPACPVLRRAQLPSPPRPLVPIHVRAVMSASNDSRYVAHSRVPLPLPSLYPPFGHPQDVPSLRSGQGECRVHCSSANAFNNLHTCILTA